MSLFVRQRPANWQWVVGRVGRLFISAGVIILAFTAYQLWGTGLLQGQTQQELESDFEQLVADVGTGPAPDLVESEATDLQSRSTAELAAPGESALPARSSATSADDLRVVSPAAVDRGAGEVVGRVSIPRIGLDEFLVQGVGTEELRKGPGHYPGTPLPGMEGNASLAGHRTTWGAPFNRIDELEPGDEIDVEMPWGLATYVVEGQDDGNGGEIGHFIVAPEDVWVLDQTGDDRLTLTSCNPKYSARQRIIVTARLVSEPVRVEAPRTSAPPVLASEDLSEGASEVAAGAPAGEQAAEGGQPDERLASEKPGASGEGSSGLSDDLVDDSFGEGLGGDRAAIPSALAWSLAAITVWSLAGYVGRRWRPRVAYAVAAIPVGTLWLVAFMFIDRAIPSY